eukprot:SAG22_NODE_5726_length_963_cov_2.126157_2_plen_82_part_00
MYGKEFLKGASIFLSFLCDTEYFRTHKEAFPTDDNVKTNFVGVSDLFVTELLSDGALEKKQIRPRVHRPVLCRREGAICTA